MTGLAQPDIAKRVVGLGYTIIRDTPAEFAEFIKADIEKWRKLVQQKGLTAE
jgi:tripartite-type tricarboxylate transporter receptor subunit TctC